MCECCGETVEDSVAHLLIEEAVLRIRVRVAEKAESDRQAWMDADEALRTARGDR
jgi:hypothetical protein